MKWFRLALVIAVFCPFTAWAQVVRGTVVDARDGAVMGAVVIQLIDATGAVVGRTMSDDRGQFRVVAAHPGTHRIRTLRIGFRPATSEALQIVAGQDIAPRIALTPVPLELAAVTVSARNACRVYADAGAAAELWDQARTAFTAARLSAGERRVAVSMTTYHRELEPGTEAVLAQQVDAQSGFTTRPFVSLPPDSLRRAGYVVASGGWTIYYAPDLDVLASDVFLADHCLRIATEDTAEIGIAFEPTRDRARIPEITGIVWLDRRTMELRRMMFSYANVSRVHHEATAGGFMQFLRVGNLWAISSWFIRMPVITRHAEFGRSPEERLTKLRVSGGDLLVVRRGADTLWKRPSLTVQVAIRDGESGAPLAGASVELRGTQHSGATDSTGRATIERVLPGIYTARVATAEMATLGITHELRLAIIDAAEVHRIAVPSLNYRLERMCPNLKPHDGVIMGRVRATGDSSPPRALQVFARWELISVQEIPGGVTTTRMPRFAETSTDATGAYTLCGVPTITALSLLTAWNPRGPGVPARLDGPARVMRLDLAADPPRAAFRGVVVDLNGGAPIADVEVVLPFVELDTRTDAQGRFAIERIPEGEQEVVFRRLGYMPISARRTFRRDSAATERVVMTKAVVLDSVVISARRTPIPGFDDRRIHRMGHAIGREELERQDHRRMSEILALIPGLRILGGGTGAAWASVGRGMATINTLRAPDRFSELRGAKPACYSDVYLDGTLIYGGLSGAEPAPLIDLNTYTARNLEAVEYFAGAAQVPAEYNRSGAACGVLLLWSRRPAP